MPSTGLPLLGGFPTILVGTNLDHFWEHLKVKDKYLLCIMLVDTNYSWKEKIMECLKYNVGVLWQWDEELSFTILKVKVQVTGGV